MNAKNVGEVPMETVLMDMESVASVSFFVFFLNLSHCRIQNASKTPLLHDVLNNKISFLVDLECGGTTTDNSTYLTLKPTSKFTETTRTCTYNICKMSDEVCRIKFDFTVFNIAGPEEGTVLAALTAANNANGGFIGDCNTDRFTVSSLGNAGAPIICGYNTGQHSRLIYGLDKSL